MLGMQLPNTFDSGRNANLGRLELLFHLHIAQNDHRRNAFSAFSRVEIYKSLRHKLLNHFSPKTPAFQKKIIKISFYY
jgi:hypothetical protein